MTTIAFPPSGSLPSSSLRRAIIAAFFVPTIATGFGVGTGGASSHDYLKMRGDKGYRLGHYPIDSELTAASKFDRSPIEDIRKIQGIFRISVTELSQILSVSRQAIYDWLNGRAIAVENLAKLKDFASAADLLEREGLELTSYVLKRKIRDGMSLVDLFRSGNPAETAAAELIRILRTERDQKEVLLKRVSSRKRKPVGAYDDWSVPILNERT